VIRRYPALTSGGGGAARGWNEAGRTPIADEKSGTTADVDT